MPKQILPSVYLNSQKPIANLTIDAFDHAHARLNAVIRILSLHDCPTNDREGIGGSDVAIALEEIERISVALADAATAVRSVTEEVQ